MHIPGIWYETKGKASLGEAALRPIGIWRLSLYSVILLLPLLSAHADNRTLDPKKSDVRFTLTSDMFRLSGRVIDYIGQLMLESNDFSKSAIELQLDLGGIVFDPPPGGGEMPLNQLFQKLRQKTLRFKSERVVSRSRSDYTVYGTMTRGGKTWKVSMPVKLLSLTKHECRLGVDYKDSINAINTDLTLPLLLNNAQGQVSGIVVFTRR